MRIEGLIRAVGFVRAQLQHGVPEGQAEAFRLRVRSLVSQVEHLCAQSGTTPNRLPGPSRAAYAYLKHLPLDQLPQRREDPSGGIVPLTIKRLVGLAQYYAKQLWARSADAAAAPAWIESMARELGDRAGAIHACCAGRGGSPADLAAPSRDAYGWLKYLSDAERLRVHVAALGRAREALARLDLRPPAAVELHLIHLSRVLWRSRGHHGRRQLKVHEGFVNADPQVWSALMACALGQGCPEARDLVRVYADSDAFASVGLELEAMSGTRPANSRGHIHDLDKSFLRVNTAYFGGDMARPRLTWSRSPTFGKFGHYDPSRDEVMLSMSLDATSVPEWVVDFVMYHELLHKKHGVTRSGGRQCAHTTAFRQEERRFERYADAVALLKGLARQLRRL